MDSKTEQILFDELVKVNKESLKTPGEEPFTFSVRTAKDPHKDYISHRFNSNKENSYLSVGIVNIGTRETLKLVSFGFIPNSFNKVSLFIVKPNKDDIEKLITAAKKQKKALTISQVNDFIDEIKSRWGNWNYSSCTIDNTLIDVIRKTYYNFFNDVQTHDKKHSTCFYDILKISQADFEKNIKKNNEKYQLVTNTNNNNPQNNAENDSADNPNMNTSDSNSVQDRVKHPLNLILYGPPGTGKTYNTVNKALDIIDGKIPNNRKDAKTRYDELVNNGQIVFTTFHQSMSYEDFVEGIKPETESETKQITYSIKPGVFKKICKEANDNRLRSKEEPSIKNRNYIQNLLNAFFDPLRANQSGSLKITYNDKKYPIKQNSPTSYTVQLTANATQNLTLSIIERDYENFKKGNIKSYKDIKPSRPSKSKDHGNSRLYWGLYQALEQFEKKHASEIPIEDEKETLKKYVIIIDEINRGNIANIFGELISLIEEKKRLGNDEELTAILPYSASMTNDDDIEQFGVPNNLYIIGTMNTADRSVEALDTALRRRFSFEEMMPNANLLKDKKVCNISLSDLLTTINKRIVALKDREHQIGHSYFMGCPDKEDEAKEWIKNVFKDKIIPLLQEYFYGDYKKIYYVLGEGFVDKKTEKTTFAVKMDDDYEMDVPSERYEINSFSSEFKIEDALSKLNVQ